MTILCADVFTDNWIWAAGGAGLAILDPPYGDIVDEDWDRISDVDLSTRLVDVFRRLEQVMLPGSHAFLWGGFGVPGNRAFFRTVLAVEERTPWRMAALNTWRKKRAYGTDWRCLLTREECARFVLGDIKKPRVFHVQHTDEDRGYAGFNKKHPAKSPKKRLTMVWDHASDMGQNKPHPQHKPAPLVDTQILMTTNPGDLVLDLFSGSGEVAIRAAAHGRHCVSVEKKVELCTAIEARLLL